MTASVLCVRTGRVAPLGPGQVPSGYVKAARDGAVAVTPLGLDGDEQADLVFHGGPDRAVYGYAAARYPVWARHFPALDFSSGAMGENLTIAGMDEDDLCVGDVHAIGSALLQVCQPRRPCFKFALRHDNKLLPRAMMQLGLSGWYYRVLKPGRLQAGDTIALQDRPNPGFTFARLIEIVYHGKPSRDELAAMAKMPGLAEQWRAHARALLE